MPEQVLVELAANGPLVAVLVWQLHTTQTRVLLLLERILDETRTASASTRAHHT